MVTSGGAHETVFTVLAAAARERAMWSLWLQLSVCALLATVIVVAAPQWWSVSALLCSAAAYAAWGLAVRWAPSAARAYNRRAVPMLLAVLGSVATLVGSVGLAMALFTGHARGIKNACGPGATDARCRAWANPPVVLRPTLP